MHHLSHIESILLAVINVSWHWFHFFQGPRNLALHPRSLLLTLQTIVPINPESLGSADLRVWCGRPESLGSTEQRRLPVALGEHLLLLPVGIQWSVIPNLVDHHLFWGMSNRVSLQLCAWYIHSADGLGQLGSKYYIPLVFISQACFRIRYFAILVASTFICQCQCDF